MKKKDNYEGDTSLDTSRSNQENRTRPDQDLPSVEDVSGTICSNKGHGDDGRSSSGLCDSWYAGRDEETISKDQESREAKARRNQLKPIINKSFYDETGLYYCSNTFYRTWDFLKSAKRGETRLETAYLRVVATGNLLHSLFESAEKLRDPHSMTMVKHQKAAIVEILRILQQEILIERGTPKEEIAKQEAERLWEQKIW